MTNAQTPPYGWRLVDKTKDRARDFDRIMLFADGQWIEHDIQVFSGVDFMHYAVPIDPGEGYRLIDPAVDDPTDHMDAQVWTPCGWASRPQQWTSWCKESTYRTPIKTPATGDGWIPGVPTKSDVRDDQFCIVSFNDGGVGIMDGEDARDEKRIIAAWIHLPPPYVPPKEPKPGEFWASQDGVCRVIGKRERGTFAVEINPHGPVKTVDQRWFDEAATHLPGVTSFDEAEDA